MLINLRNAPMTGRRLPYDAEVEYLESTGTQYVNTNVILDSTYGIDILFAPMESASGVSEHGIFGSSVSGSGSVHNVLQIHSSAGGVGLWMPSNTRICNYAITVGGYQHWQINLGNTNNVVVDGTNRGSTHPTTASACHHAVYLFARNVGGSLKSGSCSRMRLASWKVYDGNGNLVQDCIAVRKGTVGYLYDRVSGKLFGNAGTGDFVLGQDVVPVEYIESHGTEYINTGYIPNQQTRWELDYQFTSMGSGLNGMFQDNPTIRFNLGQGTDGFFNISYGANNPLSVTADTLRHLFVMDIPNLQWRIDSNNGAFPGAVTNILQNSLRIFCRNSTGGRAFNLHSGRCFASRMYQSGTLSQGLLSVRVGTEGAMMDVLTRRIYRNAGTGAFTYGNDLKYPIPSE